MANPNAKGKATAAPAAAKGKTTPAKGKAVAVRDEEERKLPAPAVAQYDVDGVGSGFEDMDASFFTLPFVRILQKNSKEVDEDSDAYVDGAKPGMAYNTATGEVYDTKNGCIYVIPVHVKHTYIEWVPIDDGGGFVAEYLPSDPIVKAAQAEAGGFAKKLSTENGNDLVETFTAYCLLTDEDHEDFAHIVISFASTNIKPFKGWMSKARSIMLRDPETQRPFTPPLFSHVYRLSTEFKQGDQFSWYKWVVTFDGKNAAEARIEQDDDLFTEAKGFRMALQAGTMKEKYTEREEGASREGGDDDEVF